MFGGFGIALIGWQLIEALRTMEIKMRGGGVVRTDERPKVFWLIIASPLPMLAVRTWPALQARGRIFQTRSRPIELGQGGE